MGVSTAILVGLVVQPAVAAPAAPPTHRPDPGIVAYDEEILRSAAAPAEPGHPTGTCGWNDYPAALNPADRVLAGQVSMMDTHPVHTIGTDRIDWAADPFQNRTWRLFFGTLKWSESLLTAYESSGDPVYLQRATEIARDFVKSNPDPGSNTGLWVDHATSARTSFLLCLQEHTGRQPWLDAAITTHGNVLANPRRYAGAYNHGIMQNIALLAAGCVQGRADWRKTSVSRQTEVAKTSLDSQGVLDEQAVGYASFIWDLWRAVVKHHRECRQPVPAGLEERLAKVQDFVAHASTPDGKMVPIGDTLPDPVDPLTGPRAGYAASGGVQGTRPASVVGGFSRGYLFGRSGWGESRAYADEQQYSLRFGPGRIRHGHNDHLGVTFYSGGRNVLVDSGFNGYNDRVFEAWSRSPEAHSVPVLPGVAFNPAVSTPAPKSSVARGVRTFRLADKAYQGTTRRRVVAVSDDPGLMLVRDDVSTDRARQIRMLWHLDPSWRHERTVTSRVQSSATFLSPDGSQRAWVLQMGARGEVLPRSASMIIAGRQSPLQGWVGRFEGDRTPAPVVEAQRYAKSVTAFTVVAVLPSTETLTMSRTRLANGHEEIIVRAGQSTKVFRTSSGGSVWAG